MPMLSALCVLCWVISVEPRKRVSAMLALTVFGALLLVPPLVLVFNQPISHFGVPQIVIYLFLVWLGLIIGTAWLSRTLAPDTSGKPDGLEDE